MNKKEILDFINEIIEFCESDVWTSFGACIQIVKLAYKTKERLESE